MRTRRSAALLCAFAALASSACGGSDGNGGAASPAPVIVQNNISITIVPAIDPVPFDPRAARLMQATTDLESVAGRRIEFRFDQALVPQFRASFADALADSIESVARALVRMKKSRPEIFATEIASLARVDCHYSASAGDGYGYSEDRDRNEISFSGGIVAIREPADTSVLINGDDVVSALEDRFFAENAARFDGKTPEQIAPADRRAYFAYATSGHARKNGSKTDYRVDEVLTLTKLSSVVGGSDPPLSSDIDKRLIDDTTFTASENFFRADSPAAQPGSRELQARDAWTTWLTASLSRLSAEERLKVARAIYDRDTPLSGFDDFAFGLGVVDEWTKEGRPITGDEKDPHFELFDLVVCPAGYDPRGVLNRNRSCRDGWAKHALTSDADTRRLADALGKRSDTKLDDGIVYELQYGKQELLTRFLRALEPYPQIWQPAVRTVLERLGAHPSIDEDEAMRIWRDHPPYRGTALYIFAFHHKESRHYADEHFAQAKKDGLALGPDVFASFLDDGPGTFALVPTVWRALTPGWSRADILASHLPRLFDDPLPKSPTYGTPELALGTIVQRFCDDKDTGEIAKLHQAFLARAKAHPENARALENVIDDTAVPARCATVGTKKDDDDDLRGF